MQRTAFLCVAESMLVGLNAAASPHSRRSAAAYVWRLLRGPESRDLEQLDQVQANPQRSVARRDARAWSSGASLWFEFLERRFSARRAGEVTGALFALSRPQAAPGRWRHDNEPDSLDVVQHTSGGRPADVADIALDFAVARALAADRFSSDGSLDLAWAGPAARVRFDWRLKFSTLPRRVINDLP